MSPNNNYHHFNYFLKQYLKTSHSYLNFNQFFKISNTFALYESSVFTQNVFLWLFRNKNKPIMNLLLKKEQAKKGDVSQFMNLLLTKKQTKYKHKYKDNTRSTE